MLISSMVGIDLRNTLDMDATIRGVNLTKNNIANILEEIIKIDIDDDVIFKIVKIKTIREEADYKGFRITLNAKFNTIIHNFKIDITTGDKIIPKEIEYKFNLLFEDRSISILAYNLETVISEKFETIISRSIANTRTRDFYDLYIIEKMQEKNYSKELLKEAIIEKFNSRGTKDNLKTLDSIIKEIEYSSILKNMWNNYKKEYSYAEEIDYKDIIKVIKNIGTLLK